MNRNYKYFSKNPILQLKQEMKLRKFSKNTVNNYLYYITDILIFANKSPKDITAEDIRNYLESLAENNKSRSTLNTAYSALKFYFEKILRHKFFVNIPRAKKDKKIPEVFTKAGLTQICTLTNKER